MPHISIVSPVYGCRTCLYELYIRLKETLEKITLDFEIILVNDGSPDGAWETIVEIARKDQRVKGIDLSRNFGQHYALTAGLNKAKGDWVVLMDCDLQDKPEEIIKLFNKAIEGNDIVLARRSNRRDGFFKKSSSVLYYKCLSYFTGTKIDASIGTFRIISKKVVDSFNTMNEKLRFFGGMINWLGYKETFVDVEHGQRPSGASSYSFKKKLHLGASGILSFSDKPLKLAIKMGIIILLLSGIYIGYKVISNLLYGTQAIGWTSLIAAIFFCTGLIIFVLGIIGLYIGKIFNEVKGRPSYIIKSDINF
jgi:polyisoprenyl-phosphate glycosyltransferase